MFIFKIHYFRHESQSKSSFGYYPLGFTRVFHRKGKTGVQVPTVCRNKGMCEQTFAHARPILPLIPGKHCRSSGTPQKESLV